MGVCMYMGTFSCDVSSLLSKYDRNLPRETVSEGLKL